MAIVDRAVLVLVLGLGFGIIWILLVYIIMCHEPSCELQFHACMLTIHNHFSLGQTRSLPSGDFIACEKFEVVRHQIV